MQSTRDQFQIGPRDGFRFDRLPCTPADKLSAEPWYPVTKNNVFPDELAPFLFSSGKVRRRTNRHLDLLTLEHGNQVKERVGRGEIAHVFPIQSRPG